MEQEDVIIPSTQKPKSNLLFLISLFLMLLLSLSLLYFGSQLSLSQKVTNTTPIPSPSPQSACVLGIKLDECCSCPEPVLKENLSKNLVEYHSGKDYSQTKLVSCKGVACEPCEPLSDIVSNQGQCQFIKQTANWKTYKNDQYNFEFEYPQKFSTVSANLENLTIALQDTSNTKQRLSLLPDITLRVLNIPQNQTFENVLTSDVVFDGRGGNPESINEFSTTKIGDNLVYFIETGRFEGILSTNYYIVRNNNVFAFVVTSSPIDWTNPNYKSQDDQLNKDFLQILSTFKFLD